MSWLRRRAKGTRIKTEGDPGESPRLSAVTAWALAHGVPYSHAVPELLDDALGEDKERRPLPDAEDTERRDPT